MWTREHSISYLSRSKRRLGRKRRPLSLSIFSEDRVRDTLKYMNVSPDAHITRDIGKDICARNGIKAMLLGSISIVGSHYVVLLDAVNSQTGDMIASEQFEVDGKEQVLKSLGPAAARLREKLGESLGMIKAFDAPIENVTTSSLEALRQRLPNVFSTLIPGRKT